MDNPTPAPLTHEAVSARARQLWQIADSPTGRDLEFWLAAQEELKLEQDQTSAAAAKTPARTRKRT